MIKFTKEVMKEYQRQWYLNNLQEIKQKRLIRIQNQTEEEKEIKKQKTKEYRIKNREKMILYMRNRYLLKKDELLSKARKYQKEHPEKRHTPIRIETARKWKENNPDKIKSYYNEKRKQQIIEYKKKRLKEDPEYKLLYSLRDSVRHSIVRHNKFTKKTLRTKELIGCDLPIAKKHIENQFKPGMTWNNHGEWHIDHIIPCSKFDLTKPEEQRICFNYRNLQPLWASDNHKKRDKILNPEHIIYLKKEVLGEQI